MRVLPPLLRRKPAVAVLMCVPLFGLILGLVAYPFFHALFLATLNKAETAFVGLDNFSFLFGRQTFWMVVRQSLLFALVAVVFKALIGLAGLGREPHVDDAAREEEIERQRNGKQNPGKKSGECVCNFRIQCASIIFRSKYQKLAKFPDKEPKKSLN